MDRGARWGTVYGATKIQIQLNTALYLKLIYKKTERENSDNNQQNMNQEQSVISSNVDRNHSQVKK